MLNDSVWAPPFSLPTMSSLPHIVDFSTIGEMFLNFQLHPDTVCSTGIDVGPLDYTNKEPPSRWMCWQWCLMGFRASPYNTIHMYLVAEEIIRGDWHDCFNPFHWESIMTNLPGTAEYSLAHSWISKRQSDNLLTSDFICFVDDQRIMTQSQELLIAAGHAISTWESYKEARSMG